MASMQPSANNNPGKSKADPGRSQDLTLEALKVDHNVVTKELAKFRACDPHTRTLYCREWAQLIYKRHFAYNAKTQEEMAQLRTISGPGGYQLCVGGPGPDTREIASSVCTRISKQMESCFLDNKDSDLGAGEFVSNLLNECESWQKLPNSMSWLPEYFDYIVFDSFPDAIPLPDDPKDPSQLLDAVVIDRISLALPSTCFHLLKNLSAEVLASQSEPICGHRKPMAKTPADLDLEKTIFTEKFKEVTQAAYNDIEMLLGDVWKDLNKTLNGLKSLMTEWRKDMGPDLLMAMSEFCRKNRDHLVGFNEYWNPRAENYKKKKGSVSYEDVDGVFFQYLEIVRDFGQIFDKEFMRPRYEAATNLVSSLQTLCGDVLTKKLNDMEQHGIDKYHKAVLESCSSARNFVLKPEHAESVQENVEAVQHKMEALLQEFYHEIDTVKKQYSNESQKTVIGRLEKLSHKDFKKRVKKLESLQQNLRQVFAADFMISIFPEQQFAQMALVTLISIMQEGEQMECDQMDDYMFDFVEENEDLLAQRDDLILDFEEGVHTGRTQLAGLIGKLFLNEGMRLQGDSLALKRQNNLLKSMGMASESAADTSNPGSGSSSKKKKKKKKKATSGVAPSEGDSSEIIDKSTPDEDELQEDDSGVVKVEEDVQTVPASISKGKTPVKEQTARETKIDQAVRKTDITTKVKQLTLATKSPVQEPKKLSATSEVAGKASVITSEPVTNEIVGHKKSKKANGKKVLSDTNQVVGSNSTSNPDEPLVSSQTQTPVTPSSWHDSNQKVPSSTSQIWGQGIMPPPKSDPIVWQDLKTEASDQLDVNDSDVQLNFDLSSIMDDNEKKNQMIIKQDVQKVQGMPSVREDNVLENNVRSVNDNSARLPPGLQMASPDISHASAASLDTMPQQPTNVMAMVANLQAENGQLLNALLTVQQDLNNMSIRYNELVKLAREREAIKANEMEEARRYILKLEAKLHLLEQDDTTSIDPHDHVTGQRRQERKRQPLSKPNRPSSSGGGDNQDRRRTNNMWRDTRAVKCGNCGEPGHKSADCQKLLEYRKGNDSKSWFLATKVFTEKILGKKTMTTSESARFPKLEPAGPQGYELLAAERKGASFDPKELSLYMHGSEYLEARESILKILENDPVLGDKSQRYYQARSERFFNSMRHARRFAELIQEHKWNAEEILIADMLIDESNQFRLHRTMFMPTIANQGTEEQVKHFWKPASAYQIIGCYAQTELGHGSNVQGLETTATYDVATQSFTLHSPTLTSAKWWIGGLGKAATHAIVMARLVTHGKDHGPHPFVVQIRSLEDHRPLKGITVGDVGPKVGFNTVDNGFVMFDNCRIPHISFLAKFSQVEKHTGNYVKPPNSKLSYGTMVFVRANIVMESRYVLARAATIAVRYAAARSQFVDSNNPKKIAGTNKVVETPVINYTMVQYRLFPVIAQAYACFFTGQKMYKMYHDNQEYMKRGDFSYLADLHATSSGLKSLTTTMSVAAIEQCRRACGGHGYSMFSGLGHFYQDYLPKVTWEGDNYLLTQQTARYLAKTFRAVAAGKDDDNNISFSAGYMRDYLSNKDARCPAQQPFDFLNPEVIITAYRYRVAKMIESFVHKSDYENRTFNSLLVLVYQISRAHCELFVVSNFLSAVYPGPSQGEASKSVLEAMRTMAMLYSLNTMEDELADFLCSGYISPDQAIMIKEQVVNLLEKVRPNAVALVDAFGLPDFLLQSALGDSQGRVYERMTSMAEMEPLNHKAVHDSYEDVIKPLIYAGKERWKRDANGIARL